jgi:Tfp pilus assembly protein PilN
VSLWQVYSFQYYSELVKGIRKDDQNLRLEKARLETELGELGTRLDRPATTAKLAEIDYLNNLIIRKHFSWTEVFSNLESVIPDNVHLNSVSPEIVKDKVNLNLEITCRSISDESEFIRRLQASPVFQDVNVSREEQKGTGQVTELGVKLRVSYFPQRTAVEKPDKTAAEKPEPTATDKSQRTAADKGTR